MAGHSQFKNIMHRKAAQDKKKAKIYTKLIRDIMTAAKQGGDPNANPNLRSALEKARKENMTKDVLERAIKRGTGEIKGADYEERTYEGYGPGGVAIIIKALTDNPTRTITNVRIPFTKFGGSIGADGTVAWMFKEIGSILYPAIIGTPDAVLEAAIMAGAEDVQSTEDAHHIITAVTDFAAAKSTLEKQFGPAEEAELTFYPTQTHNVTDEDTLKSLASLIEVLENDDDVQQVVTNLATPTSV